MSKVKRVKYTDAPDDIEEAIKAAVPIDPNKVFPAEFFAKRLAKEKITINLDRRVIDEFRDYAARHGLKYQNLMNQVLLSYTETGQLAK